MDEEPIGEVSESSEAEKTAESLNAYQLIEKHLGIKFEKPPREVSYNSNRRHSPFDYYHKELDMFRREEPWGRSFGNRNMYKVDTESGLRERLHESMHALHHELDPNNLSINNDIRLSKKT